VSARNLCIVPLVALIVAFAAQSGWAECRLTETEVEGEPALVLENDFVQLRLRPTLGGRIDRFLYKPTNTPLTALTDGGALVDRVWNYANRDIYFQWTNAAYGYKLEPGAERAAVTLSCPGSAGVIGQRMAFEKTISLSADSAAVRADYTFSIATDAMVPQRAGLWWHNKLGVPQETTTYYVPTLQGIKSLAYGAGASGPYWWYDVARGWAAALGESGTGVAAITDYRKLMCFFHAMRGEVAMLEWAFRSEEIPNGGSTSTTVWLVPFSGLTAVSGASEQVVGEIQAAEQVSPDQAKAGVPVTVKLTGPQQWSAQVKMTWQRLPEGKVNELPAWEAQLSPESVAEKQLELQLPEPGTYVLRAQALSGDRLAADFFAQIVVGEASGEITIAPLQDRLGREGERLEDKIAGTAAAKYMPPSEEIVTPHMKWAKPYAGGKLKALILNDFTEGRETIELAQRLDMEYVAPHISSPYSMSDTTRAQAMDIVRDCLQGELDVILISGISAAILTDDVVEMMLDKVRAGSGLIMVNPNHCSEALWAALPFSAALGTKRQNNKWQAVAQHYLTVGIPWEELPPTDTYKYDTAGEVLVEAGDLPLLAVRETGQGRVVCLAYATGWSVPGGYKNALTPWIQFAPTRFAYWEYYFSLLAKCMVWAGQKEPPVQLVSVAPEQDPYMMRLDQQPALKLNVTNSAAAVELVARVTVNDQHGRLVRSFDKAFVAPPGTSDLAILLPELYGGLHLADIIVEDAQGRKVTWATVPVHVQPPVAVTGLNADDDIYRAGDTVSAQVALSAIEPAPATVRLVTTLTDAYGRVVVQQEQQAAAQGDCDVTLEMPVPLATTAVLRVEARDDKGLLSAAEQKLLTMPPAWDRREWTAFRSMVTRTPVGGYSRQYLQQVRTDLVKNVGIDTCNTTSQWLDDTEQRSTFAVGMHSQVFGVAANVLSVTRARSKDHLTFAQQREAYVRTHDKQYLQRAWCLNADDTRQAVGAYLEKTAAAVARYRPLGYVCGDELSVTDHTTPFDYDFNPGCLEKFRQWLQQQYPSLAALNAEWDTDFATWHEVMPMTADEVGDRSNYAPWADHRTFMEVTLAEFIRWMDRTLESYDPGARLGTSGTQPAAPYGGHDWWRLSHAFDFLRAYDSQNMGEMHRSFNDQMLVATVWSHYQVKDPVVGHRLWHVLLNGADGAVYFNTDTLVKPDDYTYTQAAADGGKHIIEMRSGVARLLHECDGRAADVYMHYSQPSIHGTFITGSETSFKDNRAGWVKAIEDNALQMKFLSYAQLEAGELTKLMPAAFILPYSVAISDKEAEQIKAYVEAGGVLIADARTGLMDEHCAPRSAGVLDELFGIERTEINPKARRRDGEAVFTKALGECDPTPIVFQDLSGDTTIKVTSGTALGEMAGTPVLIVRNVGKGKAVLLNLFMDSYPRRRDLAVEQPLRQLLGEVFDLAGVKPFAQIAAPDAGRYYVARYYSGDADYLGILRGLDGEATGEAEASPRHFLMQVEFPRQAHVYDLRGGEYLGTTDHTEKLMAEGHCQMYSLLPYQVTAVSVTPRAKTKQPGDRVAYQVGLVSDGQQPGMHVFRVQVSDPSGVKDYYGTQITADDGSGEAEFDLALNDAPGTWEIRATDVATGISGTAQFTVTAARGGE